MHANLKALGPAPGAAGAAQVACAVMALPQVVVIGLLFVVINLIVDLLYFVVDPRLRTAGGNARVGGH